MAIVGREGMTGLPTVLGGDTLIYASMVQVPGEGWRIATPVFRSIIERRPTINEPARLSATVVRAGLVVTLNNRRDGG